MVYVPDPTDVTQPTDAIVAETAQAEFRALKAYIAGLAGLGGGMNLFRKNRIINGDCRIDQRNAGAATAVNGTYGPDRQKLSYSGVITGSLQKKTDTPPPGFSAYSRIATTSNVAPGANDVLGVTIGIEGYDCEDLHLGLATAAKISISGYFRSTKIGTYPICLRNGVPNRTYIGTINIAAANVWQYCQINLTGDTAGVWATDNTIGINLGIFPVVGATLLSAPNVWTAGNFLGATGQIQNSANIDTFDYTGLQLEQAAVASPFEYRPFSAELALCQRYYEKSYLATVAPGTAATRVGASILFVPTAGTPTGFLTDRYKVTKRTAPTVVVYSTVTGAAANVRNETAVADIAAAVNNQGDSGHMVAWNGAVGSGYSWQWTADAEL